MSSFVRLRRAVAFMAACCAAPAFAAPFAYVSNNNSDDVSVIDTATNTVVATVPVGDNPYGVGITKDNAHVYVVNFSSNSISVIDAQTNTVTTTISNVCTNPAFAEPSPNGTEMWISCFNNAKLVVVDTTTNTVVGEVTGQARPLGITFNADGTRAYVASNSGSTMRIIDTATRAQIASVGVGGNSIDVQLNPAGTRAYVVANIDNRVAEVNLANNQYQNWVISGGAPVSLVFSPTGTRLYVTNTVSSNVSVTPMPQTGSNTLIATGGGAHGIDRNTDGSRVYVTNRTGNSVSVIDTSNNTVVATIPVGNGPATYGRFVAKGPPLAQRVPDPPTGVVAAAGNAEATVTFTPPANNGGSAIDHYTATCGARSAQGAASPVLVSFLPIGVPVTCTVTATNSGGSSAPSAPSNSVTPYAAVPGAPTAVVATAADYAISVAFSATYDGGSPVQQFTATCSAPDLSGTYVGTAATSPVVVPNTPNAHTYTCTVFATNAIGAGAASTPSAGVVPDSVPAKPLVATPVRGNGSFTVAFTAGDAPHGHTPITSWRATCGTQQASGTASPLVVSGLPNGTPQTCSVIATNAKGDSPPSDASAAVVPAGVPDAPTITSTVRGDGKVIVGFTVPANNGSAIQGYIINCGDMNVFGGNNPLPVGGLANGVPVTCRMRARNDVGDGPWSASTAPVTPAGPPAAPADVVATRGNGQVSVAFTPGDTGGLTPTYTAKCGTQTASGNASPLVVTGLPNGTAVTCEAWGTNEVGAGTHGVAAPVTPATVPDAPTITNVARGNGKVTVTFTAPANNGGDAVQGYIVACGSQVVFGGNLSLPVSNLTNGVAVTCTVKARNGVGDGAASAPSASVTPATTPDAPTAVVATRGNREVSVGFVQSASNGGAAITLYKATCGSASATGTVSPIVVTGLVNGTPVACTVLATNDVGDGAPSAPSASVTPATVPDAPTSVVATRGNAQASVAFVTPVNDGGSAVTSYAAVCGLRSSTGNTSPVVVTGLANGTAVTCAVYAVNDVGNSVASATSNSVTPATVPDAPTLTAAIGDNGSAQLTFTAPAQTGGLPVTGYGASCTPGTHTATGASSPLTVSGLTNGQTYTCSVTAVNDAGAGFPSGGLSVVPRLAADLAVTIDNGARFITSGSQTSYLIDVLNTGASPVTGVRVRDTFGPAFTNVSWICSAQGGSTCPQSGNGDIDAMVNIEAGSRVSFLATATVPGTPEAPVSNTVTITPPNSVNDTNATNDSATDGPDAVGIFADGFE